MLHATYPNPTTKLKVLLKSLFKLLVQKRDKNRLFKFSKYKASWPAGWPKISGQLGLKKRVSGRRAFGLGPGPFPSLIFTQAREESEKRQKQIRERAKDPVRAPEFPVFESYARNKDEPAEEDPDLGKHEANQQARDRKEEP